MKGFHSSFGPMLPLFLESLMYHEIIEKRMYNFKCAEQNIILSCGDFFTTRVCWFSLLKLYFQAFTREMALIIGTAHPSKFTVLNLEQNINI